MKTLLAILVCVMAAGLAQAQPSRFSREKYIENSDTLYYRMLFPDATKQRKYPLVIFLHGSGERGNDNDAQLKWGVMNFATDQNMLEHPAVVIAPQCPERQTWSSVTPDKDRKRMTLNAEPSVPMRLLIGLIRQLETKMPIDTNRIYITGLSMGGYGTYDALERYPALFAAAVPVCGAGDTSRVASIAHVPMWIYLGAEDPAVNPLNGLAMLEALTNAGAHPGFTQYPEVGHFSWLGAYSDPLMMEWLFRQHK